MSEREVRDYIEDVISQIEKIEEFVSNINDFNDFRQNEMVVYACIRAFEMMGEAVKHVSVDIRKAYPQIPWRTIAGFRDVLIHAYFGIDEQIVWKSIIFRHASQH